MSRDIKLSDDLKYWRAERPDEWTMDDFVRKARKLEALLPQWTRVEDGLPEMDEMVLFWYESGNIVQGCIDKDDADLKIFKMIDCLGAKITHWMLLPQPPKDKP